MKQPTAAPPHNQIDRRWWWLWATVWAVLMLLGSWYPFEYREGTFDEAWWIWRTGGGWAKQARTDLAINLLLAVPLGFLSCLAVLKHPRSASWPLWRFVSPALAILFVASWSLLVEFGQQWFGYRVPSQADTAAQVLGGFLGVAIALIGGTWFCRRAAILVGRDRDGSPVAALLDLYLAGYVLWMLMPLLPVTSSELVSKWHSLLSSKIFADPWQAIHHATVPFAIAIPFGWAIASRLRIRWPRIAPFAAGALAAILLEIAQVFVQTRTAAADDAIGSALGAMLGVWAFGAFTSSTSQRTLDSSSRGLLFAISTILFSIVYVLVAWAPFDFADTSAEIRDRMERFGSQSFRSWLTGDDMGYASNLIRSLFWSALLGGLAGMTVVGWSRKMGLGWLLAVIFCALVCVAAEGGQILSRQHEATVIGLVTRLFGCLIGLALAHRAGHAAVNRVAET